MMKKTLTVFDIDDTLFTTEAKIRVRKNGEVQKILSNTEFNHYKLDHLEEFDFSEFRDAKIFRYTAKPIHPIFQLAKDKIKNNTECSKTILLTARQDFDDLEVFLQTFYDHNFPIHMAHVERAGNLSSRYRTGGNISKLAIIKRYVDTHKFERVEVFDDCIKNLVTISKLRHFYPKIHMDMWLVKGESLVSWQL